MYEIVVNSFTTRDIQRAASPETGPAEIMASHVPTPLAVRIVRMLNEADAQLAPEFPAESSLDDDIKEAMDDAISDAEGRANARSIRRHLAKRGLRRGARAMKTQARTSD